MTGSIRREFESWVGFTGRHCDTLFRVWFLVGTIGDDLQSVGEKLALSFGRGWIVLLRLLSKVTVAVGRNRELVGCRYSSSLPSGHMVEASSRHHTDVAMIAIVFFNSSDKSSVKVLQWQAPPSYLNRSPSLNQRAISPLVFQVALWGTPLTFCFGTVRDRGLSTASPTHWSVGPVERGVCRKTDEGPESFQRSNSFRMSGSNAEPAAGCEQGVENMTRAIRRPGICVSVSRGDGVVVTCAMDVRGRR